MTSKLDKCLVMLCAFVTTYAVDGKVATYVCVCVCVCVGVKGPVFFKLGSMFKRQQQSSSQHYISTHYKNCTLPMPAQDYRLPSFESTEIKILSPCEGNLSCQPSHILLHVIMSL